MPITNEPPNPPNRLDRRRPDRRHKRWKGPPLAWRNLLQSKARLFVGIAAISFAVALVFMQLGLLGAVTRSATLLYDLLDFDIVLISSKSPESLYVPPFSKTLLYQAGGVRGISTVSPIYLGFQSWRNAATAQTRLILMLGFRTQDRVLRLPEVEASRALLDRPDGVLMNRFSRAEFGPREIGLKTELGRREVEIVGLFDINNTLRADGTVIASDRNFIRLSPGRSLDDISLGLIKIEPGTSVDQVVQQLRAIMPATVQVLSREAATARDRNYWVRSTSIGYIIGVGVLMAILVGTVIVYQVLNADVTDHLQEYATLKAIGYRNASLLSVILQEALLLSAFGFVPGCIMALGMYQIIFTATRLPVGMTLSRLVLVLGLTLMICGVSGLVAALKVLVADPADVF